MKRILLAMLLLLPVEVSAAVIHGSIYDLELNQLKDVVVEISTSPKQLVVAKNGSYSFVVPPGAFNIKATHLEKKLVATEQITVRSDGSYVLDLLLFPSFEEEEFLLNESEIVDVTEEDIPDEPTNNNKIGAIIFFIFIILALVSWFSLQQHKKNPEETETKEVKSMPDSLDGIVDFIKSEGGRTTQKEIRKKFPFSEAKISLMLDELEAKGTIKKLKKGRGNIIILEKATP